jgi:hypothetical protein
MSIVNGDALAYSEESSFPFTETGGMHALTQNQKSLLPLAYPGKAGAAFYFWFYFMGSGPHRLLR